MKHRICLICLIIALLVTAIPAHAAAPDTEAEPFSQWSEGLDAIMAQYIEEHDLDGGNFSLGYLYTGTGEYWYYNEEAMYMGCSTYKVPLNMRIIEKVLAGELSRDDIVLNVRLPLAQWLSIVNSNNPISQEMQEYLVGYCYNYYSAYRTEIAKYFTDDPTSLPASYYSGRDFCTEYLLNTLVYLNEHEETFSELIGYMKEAAPGRYFRLYEGDYEIAHKYGYYDGNMHDMAIVYTPTPFLLVVMSSYINNAEEVLGELCQLMTEYTLSLDVKYEQERQDAIAEAAVRTEATQAQQAAAAEAAREALQLEAAQEETEDAIRDVAASAVYSSLQSLLPFP